MSEKLQPPHIPSLSRRKLLQSLGIASAIAATLGLKTDATGQGGSDVNSHGIIYADAIGTTPIVVGQNNIGTDISKNEQNPPPPDVISSKELLEKWRTRIWNTPEVELFLRKEAVEKEAIFKDLSMFQGYLDIVLINGVAARSEFLTPEQREAMPKLLDFLQSSEKLQEEEVNKPISKEEYIKEVEALDNDYAHKKITHYQWQTSQGNLQSRYDKNGKVQGYSGFFVPSFDIRYDLLPPDANGSSQPFGVPHYYIVVAVGDKTLKNVQGAMAPLDISQSYPDPSTYTIDPDDLTYPVKSDRIGWAVRHEFGHSTLITDQLGVRPLSHPKVDWLALQKLRDAYSAYNNGNDSLYYFVFRKNGRDIYTDIAPKNTTI